MESVQLCARCDGENGRRSRSLFCSARCEQVGKRISDRRYRLTGQRPKPKTVPEWRAAFRRYAEKGELVPYGADLTT
jgi:hypothetical protein